MIFPPDASQQQQQIHNCVFKHWAAWEGEDEWPADQFMAVKGQSDAIYLQAGLTDLRGSRNCLDMI